MILDWNEEHKRHLTGYEGELDQAYSDLIKRVSELTAKTKAAEELFSFAKQKLIKKQIDEAFSQYRKKVFDIVTKGITKEWDFANVKNDTIRQSVLDRIKSKLTPEEYERVSAVKTPRNLEALEAFQKRKRGKLTISDRVWNIANNARTELEFAIDVSLSNGTSANEIARNIRKNLNHPDKLFRRVRDKHGNLVMSRAMKNYHSGRGVYRNANQNALRFAANEINIAYKESDWWRMYQNRDVVGYRVFLSPQHKVYDMCDELKGNYPKGFKYNGWHVRCKCGIVSILKTDAEIIAEIKKGLELPPKSSENYIANVPDNFTEWIKTNRKTIERRKSKPNFITDNFRYGKIVHGLKPLKKANQGR